MKKIKFLAPLILAIPTAVPLISIYFNPEKIKKQTTVDVACNQCKNAKFNETIPLRNLAQRAGMKVGTSVLIDALRQDAKYREVLAREFNILTPENAMKFGQLSRERNQYDFTDADEIVAFAQTHQMEVHGHTLVWHRNLPDWFKNGHWSREEAMDILKQHIYTVVQRYRGKIASWDVVNEAVDDSGELRDSIWLRTIGPDYIEMAFRWAHEADPDARLFYNDYKGEGLGKKSDAIYKLVKELRDRNVPIDGVGFQMHASIKNPPYLEAVSANIQRLGDLKLEVRLSEMDVKISSDSRPLPEKLAAQAKIYQEMTHVCLKAPNCNTLSTWGVSDRFSWIPSFFNRPDAPLLFDESYYPKPAYKGLVETFNSID